MSYFKIIPNCYWNKRELSNDHHCWLSIYFRCRFDIKFFTFYNTSYPEHVLLNSSVNSGFVIPRASKSSTNNSQQYWMSYPVFIIDPFPQRRPRIALACTVATVKGFVWVIWYHLNRTKSVWTAWTDNLKIKLHKRCSDTWNINFFV